MTYEEEMADLFAKNIEKDREDFIKEWLEVNYLSKKTVKEKEEKVDKYWKIRLKQEREAWDFYLKENFIEKTRVKEAIENYAKNSGLEHCGKCHSRLCVYLLKELGLEE